MLKYVALIAFFVAAPASAKNWYYVGMADDRDSAYFVDRDSIGRGSDGSVTAITYSVHRTDSPDDGTASAVLTLEFDCSTPRYRFVHLTGYNASLKQSYDEAGSRKWRDVAANSLDDVARKFVCSGGNPGALNKAYGAALPFAEGRRRLQGH